MGSPLDVNRILNMETGDYFWVLSSIKRRGTQGSCRKIIKRPRSSLEIKLKKLRQIGVDIIRKMPLRVWA